jgi:hypothetical protein
MVRLARLWLPLRKPEDVMPFLADPDQYRDRRSAKLIAETWSAANKLPKEVERVLDRTPRLRGAELVDAFMERCTDLGDRLKPSQSDLLAVLALKDELAVMAVEGKVKESFGKRVSAFLMNASKRSGKPARLKKLRRTLGLESVDVDGLRYQLLHRTASAIYEAHRYRAKVAVMMVHSFDPGNSGFDDFKSFADAMFADAMNLRIAEPGRIEGPVEREAVDLYLGWTADLP